MINQGALSAATTPAFPDAPLIAPFPRAAGNPEYSFEASRDRILLTLLALDLMLMAFFVVMNSTATFDAKKSAQIAESLAPPARPATQTVKQDAQQELNREPGQDTGSEARLAASAQLRAAVADVFQAFLPQGAGVTAAPDDGRVDLDMPGAITDTDGLPADVIAGLADMLGNPPSGYRTELLIRGQEDPQKLARLARDLTVAGVAPENISVGAISVGTLIEGSGTAGRTSEGGGPLRFTFMLLDPGEETHAITAAAGKGRP